MHMRAGQRLRFIPWAVGERVALSLNTRILTVPAFIGAAGAMDGFSLDVTAWLTPGRNIVTATMIGPPAPVPFRLSIELDGRQVLTLDEEQLLPSPLPWRMWTWAIEVLTAEEWGKLHPWRVVNAPPTVAEGNTHG